MNKKKIAVPAPAGVQFPMAAGTSNFHIVSIARKTSISTKSDTLQTQPKDGAHQCLRGIALSIYSIRFFERCQRGACPREEGKKVLCMDVLINIQEKAFSGRNRIRVIRLTETMH